MLTLLALTLLADAPAAPPLDTVLREAAKANTPVVVDVFTTWCKPCAKMDKEVFPAPPVKAALGKVRFVRYDAERGAGLEVARRYDVVSFPTVLVLNADGQRIGRVRAQDPEGFVHELDELTPLARVRGPFTDEVRKTSKDARVLYVGGLISSADEAVAAEWFNRAAAADPHGTVGARAAFAALPFNARRAVRDVRRQAVLDFLGAYPGSPEAVSAVRELALLEVDLATARPQLDAVRAAVVATRDSNTLNDLIYVLLAVGDFDGAIAAGEALVALAPKDGMLLDSLAEAHFQAGHREKAVELEKKALTLTKHEGLVANLARFQSEAPVRERPSGPSLFAERASGAAPSDAAAPPAAVMERFREEHALAVALGDACKASAGTQKGAWVRLFIAAPKVTRALVFEPGVAKDLQACLERAALTQTVSEHPEPLDLRVQF